MGKFLLCSSKDTLDEVAKHIVGFKSNASITSDFGSLLTYSKLNIQTGNMYLQGDDFCAGTGTFIYDSKIGSEALKLIWEDFNEDLEVRKKILGSYCIIIRKNKKTIVFVDSASTYNVFYRLSDDYKKITMSNTYFHIALSANEKANEKFLIADFQHRNVGSDTPFENIKKIMGNQILMFDNSLWKIVKVRHQDVDLSISVVDKAIEMFKDINKIYPSSGVFMTGGQDSRLALSLMLNRGMKPTLYYGIGDSEYTNTKTQDYECVKQISEKFGLPIQVMNWKNSNNSDSFEYFKRYGELAMIYSMNTNIFDEFQSKIKSQFVAFGYFGEVYRNVESIENYKKEPFSLDDYIDDLFLAGRGSMFLGDYYDEYRSYIKGQLEIICDEYNLNCEKLTKQDFQTLNTVYRQRWDTVMNNFANQFCYSFPFFGDYQLTRRAEMVDYDEKENSKFLLSCMKALCCDVLELPFFSHIKLKKYDNAQGILYDAKTISRLKDKIRSKIHSPKLMKFARKIYYLILRDKKGKIECDKQYEEKASLKAEWNDVRGHFNLIDVDYVYSKGSAQGIKQIILYCIMLDLIYSN